MPENNIPLLPVISSLARSIGYDPETRTLAVEHHDRSLYHYKDVHPLQHQALMSSKSKGTYLHKNIRGKHAQIQIK